MNKFFKGTLFYVVLIATILFLVTVLTKPTSSMKKIPFSEFYEQLKDKKVETLQIVDVNTIKGTIKGEDSIFITYLSPIINTENLGDEILKQTQSGDLKAEALAPPKTNWIMEMLPLIVMIIMVVSFWFIFMQQTQGGGSKVMGFGRSRAKMHKDDLSIKITFKDVAGLDEEKTELEEVVDFLKEPKKYLRLGARIPKGVLLVGPPGTGKTYLSKAVAGEAGVPFFSISGSDFVEMFVGVGASRVRDLFDQAKKASPCIVFIDEIDAVGRRRGAGLGGGHDEREQTLNQLLVEMDGFGINEGIIVMAATNRPDILDPALLRPGRFDRQIMVGTPDVKGREAILRVHTENKPLADDVDLHVIARGTAGFTPADIENLMNEAALLSARAGDKMIRMETIEEAIVKVIVGVAKTSRVITDAEKKLTAYHEGGHAVLHNVLKHTDPVHQVTIIPRGMAGGFTMSRPVEDRYYTTKTELEEELVTLLGGRVAESLVLDDISTGASNDLERVEKIARAMVTKYAMTDTLGALVFGDSSDEVFLGKDFTTRRNYSEEVASEIDREVKKIVDHAYETTRSLLIKYMQNLHNVAQALIVYETLDAKQFQLAFNGELPLEDLDAITDEKAAAHEREKSALENTIIIEKQYEDSDKYKEREVETKIEESKEKYKSEDKKPDDDGKKNE